LEFLQLPASPHLWADKSAPATGRRFYRAVVFAAPANMAIGDLGIGFRVVLAPGQPGTTTYTDTNAAPLAPLSYRVGVNQ